ncbi:MAG: sensor histidine kinase [Gemmatimonadota bacterium]|nr:sensor histidine kinase [Gemmatimonadota bacterium]MDE3014668.1 sensor histidine kinase [Gemmatimonadota bacterium]
MNSVPVLPSDTELAAAYLQLAITLGLVVLCSILNRRYRRQYFGLWSVAWAVYSLRLVAIITFLITGAEAWLFWHQVATGWTAVAFLWAALVFAQRAEWRPVYGVLVFFPVVWAFVGIYVLDNFLLAAGPMIGFLSITTAATGWAFLRYDRLVGSPAGRFLAVVLFLWALHHLDYPILRAQGAWNPWGYYLDITFSIGVGLGIVFLVLEDLDQGLANLTALSGELQGGFAREEPMAEAMLRRALSLRGVQGSALWISTAGSGHFVQGAGVAALWPFEGAPEAARQAARRVRREGVPTVARAGQTDDPEDGHAYTAALPVLSEDDVVGAVVVVGRARDPFTVLDNRFLLAFGQQVGAALANEELSRNLISRTEELERLQSRMVHQHEEERARIWRELHDETAQVLAALNLQLGVIAERSDEASGPALERARTLLGEGIKSIRSVTRNLRPVALDDLGLIPAMRALARDFHEPDALQVEFDAPLRSPPLSGEAESAVYRAMQEGLSNAVRHGARSRVSVRLTRTDSHAVLTVEDDGPGFPEDAATRLRSRGGLAGIRERVAVLGGELMMGNRNGAGAEMRVELPLQDEAQE